MSYPSLCSCLIYKAFLVVLIVATPNRMFAETPKAWIDNNLDGMVSLYEHFHENPELSYQEVKTSARVAAEFSKLGISTKTKIGGHGVVGIIENGSGPTVMVRGDLDALPVVEKTGLPYASKVRAVDDAGVEVGVMHACGHDVHTTNLISVARYLATNKDEWSGTVMLVAQPAEERGTGALSMLKDGLFTKIKRPNYALGLHVDSSHATGLVVYRGGYAWANVDSVDITMRGRGGHGAAPHRCIDPIVQSAQLIVELQTIVSREVSPLEPAVVTVGSIHAGTKHNIIPDSCHLQLTVRSYSDEVRKQLQTAIARKAEAVATSHRAPKPIIKFTQGSPSVFNDESLVERVVPAFQEALGPDKVIQVDRGMGGEDFARYGRAGVPAFMFRVGSLAPKRIEAFALKGLKPPGAHSAFYYPEPRETLRAALIAMASAVLELLPKVQR